MMFKILTILIYIFIIMFILIIIYLEYIYRNKLKEMEKDKTLDKDKIDALIIRTKIVNDKESIFEILYQDNDIFERGKFNDEVIGVASSECPAWVQGILFLRGTKNEYDNMTVLVSTDDIPKIYKKVDELNDKYGIKKI